MHSVRSRWRRASRGALLSALAAFAALSPAAFPTTRVRAQPLPACPAQPQPSLAADPPTDVCIGGPGLPIAFFDDYSWRAFVAMVWPADPAHRGQPDKTLPVGDVSRPRVFETYKSEWELFPPPPAQPTAWSAPAASNPCGLPAVSSSDFVLGAFSFSKFGNLGEAGKPPGPPLVGTLVAQNGTYVRYATGFNEVEYDQIFSQKLYLASNQNNVRFQAGAIDVKSAWMDMANVPSPERYYTRTAWVLDPATGTCSQKLVGLIGLHIVQKTPSRPQWIWSTFEQVDNVTPANGHGMALNDGSATPMPSAFPPANAWPPQVPPPPPYNVQRLLPIHASTQQTNAAYQAALKGTVWANYQLVMTQWPVPSPPTLPSVDPSQSGKPGFTFPGVGATTAFANTALETFDQRNVNTGCMNCHTATQQNTDFLWSLAVNGVTAAGGSGALAKTLRLQTASRPLPRFRAAAQAKDLRELFGLLRAAQSPSQPRTH